MHGERIYTFGFVSLKILNGGKYTVAIYNDIIYEILEWPRPTHAVIAEILGDVRRLGPPPRSLEGRSPLSLLSQLP